MMTNSNQESTKTDVSISGWAANIIALIFMPVIGLLVLIPYWLIWGEIPVLNQINSLGQGVVVLVSIVVSVVIHEGLHGLGFVQFGKLPWSAVEFGFHWKAFAPYAHCESEMTARAYRGSVFLPGLILGILPSLAGLIIGNGWVVAYGVLMLMAAGGDFIILWVIRAVPATAIVVDHPSRPGCSILSQSS